MMALLLVGVATVIILFNMGMKPDKKEEEKVIAQAKEYMEEKFEKEDYEIYDVLYDNMGNYTDFEYAARVRLSSGDELYVFYHDTYDQVVHRTKDDVQ